MTGIVVGVDRATGSAAVLRWALAEAARAGSRVSAVHAWRLPLSVDVPVDAETLDALGLVDRDLPCGPAGLAVCAAEGEPGPVLVRRAAEADLLVVGGRGAHHTAGTRRDHVLTYCLTHASTPVAIVPRGGAEAPGHRRIVVGVDASAGSQRALRWGAEAARAAGATLVAMHAWQAAPHSVSELVHRRPSLLEHKAAATARLSCWVHQALGTPTVPVELSTPHGAPLDLLLEQALTADVLVLGAGQGTVHLLLTGSLTRQLARLCPCPMVVLPGGGGLSNDYRHRQSKAR
jgi:nucleotide-binding universal stress UspA family protein